MLRTAFASFASIVSAGFVAVGATVYSFGLSKSLAVVFCCFLLSSSICGVLAWRDRRAGNHISRIDSR